MSIKMIEQVLEHSKSKGLARTVLLAIANHADDDGRCWPGMARLAKFANSSIRNVKRVVHGSLKKSGELEISVGGGRHHTNEYRIRLQSGKDGVAPPLSDVNSGKASSLSDAETVATRTETVANRTGNSGTTPPESSVTVKEPSAPPALAPGERSKPPTPKGGSATPVRFAQKGVKEMMHPKPADAAPPVSAMTARIEKALGIQTDRRTKGKSCPACKRGIVWKCIDNTIRCESCLKVFDAFGNPK